MGRGASGESEGLLIQPDGATCAECGQPLEDWQRCYSCDPTSDSRIVWTMDQDGRFYWDENMAHDDIDVDEDSYHQEFARGEIDWFRDGTARPSFSVFPDSSLSADEVARLATTWAVEEHGVTIDSWEMSRYLGPGKGFERRLVSGHS